MQNNNKLSRRRFLQSTGALSGSSLLNISMPALAALTQAACSAKELEAPFSTLGTAEAADLAAIAARIMPTTDTPGATEAGVIYFFDRALGNEMKSDLPAIRSGLEALNNTVASTYAGKMRFAELSAADQDRELENIDGNALFSLAWHMTMFGFFAMSRHGGNKDDTAWKLIGYAGHHGAWQAPFGYYDAADAEEPADD